MATMNLGGAVQDVMSPMFWMNAGLVAAGSLSTQMFTGFARDNVVDIGFQGGDALYAVVLAVAYMGFMPRRWGRPLAYGAAASGAITAAREYNVI